METYIIDTYNKYNRWDREHACYIFELNEQQYAIKRVISFSNSLDLPLDVMGDRDPETYRLYPTLDNALQFVKYMQYLNK